MDDEKHLQRETDRREFMGETAAGAAALGLAGSALASDNDGIPKRPLGKTGEQVSILGLGGFHLGSISEEKEAVKLVHAAIDRGVTFMDNAWEYHAGRSERLMGKALQGAKRDKVFLMTKHHGRKDPKKAMKHLEDSLRRLKTDVIDLWQYHEVVWLDDPQMIFSDGGAIEAAAKAKEQGKVKYIGFTGHKFPDLHLEMLGHHFDWDALQMPVNLLDAHYRSFQKRVLPVAQEKGVGVIGMKSLAAGWLKKAGVVDPEMAIRYSLSQPISTLVSGMDSMEVLEKNARIATGFKPLSESEQKKLLEATKEAAKNGEYEPFKTTRMYDAGEGRKLHDFPT